MLEVASIKREEVSDKYIRHIVDQGQVDQKMYLKDYIWNMGVRCGINRDHYKIPTGLYRFGNPNENSKVILTGNYKLTFDYLRRYLKKDYWVIIIDTDGINVWCAAGKGRFGTAEVIRMLKAVSWPVNHNEVILPQLSGPGVQSHLVSKHTGKKVVFGPIRIEDMDDFVECGLKGNMRTISFNLKERLILVPNEIVASFKYIGLALIISLLPIIPFDFFWIILIGSLIGNMLFQVVLPILPFKMFFKNGYLLSLLLIPFLKFNPLSIGMVLLGMTYTSFVAMNFTGSTTYTSLSGVNEEMKVAIPLMIKTTGFSLLLLIVGIVMEVI